MGDFIFVTRPSGEPMAIRASAIAFFLTRKKEPCFTGIWFSGFMDDLVVCKEDYSEILRQLQELPAKHGGQHG